MTQWLSVWLALSSYSGIQKDIEAQHVASAKPMHGRQKDIGAQHEDGAKPHAQENKKPHSKLNVMWAQHATTAKPKYKKK